MKHPRLTRLAALLATVGLVIGLPWLAGLLSWPDIDMTLLTWEVRLRSGQLPPGVGTAAVIIALWGVWTLYLAVLAVEILGRLRRRPVRMRYLRPLQLLAATTLGTITISPALAQATPVPAVATEVPEESEDERASTEQEATEPYVVDRSRVIDSFGYDSAELTTEMTDDVEAISDLIAEHGAPELPIVVTGHTDAAGDPDYNHTLSERRAEAVAEELRTHLGEDVVVEARGEGDRALLDTDDDAAQRRVEISYSVLVTPPPDPDTMRSEPDRTEAGDEAEDAQGPPVGLSLPGGIVLAMTTGVVGLLAGMGIERRSGLRPERRDDKDWEDGAVGEATREVLPPVTTATVSGGPQESVELALIDLARAPGLGITGPGAHGAARTLLSRALTDAPNTLTVVVPASDLQALLGEDARRFPRLGEEAAVTVTDTVEDALTLLQLAVLSHHAEDDGQEAAENAGDSSQFLVLTRADSAPAAEISSLLAHTGPMPISAVLLGPWPGGATCTIDANGTITDADAPFSDLRGHHWALTGSGDLIAAATTQHHPALSESAPSDTADHGQAEKEPVLETAHGAPTGTPVEGETGRVSVTVLGHITVSVNGRQVRPRRRAALEVLAYLAAHPAGVRMEAAVEEMWPADGDHRGIRRFHDACTSLRTACRPLLGEDATRIITHDGDLYRLTPDLVACDLWKVEDLLAEADHSHSADPISAAAALWDDDFAAETDYLWVHGPRTRLRERLVAALVRTAATQEPLTAQSLLHRALEIDPTNSDTAHDLIRLCLDRGDVRAAQRIYHQYTEALNELGEQPSQRITRLLGGAEVS